MYITWSGAPHGGRARVSGGLVRLCVSDQFVEQLHTAVVTYLDPVVGIFHESMSAQAARATHG